VKTLVDLMGADERPAVVVPDGPTRSYRDLAETVNRVKDEIAAGDPGRPIALALPNGLAAVSCFLGVTAGGRIAAPMNPALTEAAYRFALEDARAQALIVPPEGGPAADAARGLGIPCWVAGSDGELDLPPGRGDSGDVRPESVAMFVHTSGTTARPKGVPLTHANICASLEHIGETYALEAGDVTLVVMPLFHVHGLIGVALSTLARGGTLVIPPRFSASHFWGDVAAHGVTWYSAVPTIHQILLERAESDGAPRGAFRFIRSCSAALSPTVLRALEARFEAPVLEAYGMTEAAHQMASNPLPPGMRKAGTVGRGTGVEIGVLAPDGSLLAAGARGEVAVRGPNVMGGYLDNPSANAAAFSDGWFRTGDEGMLDGDGYLRLTGRLKELINRGGEKISPLEVDDALLAADDVAQAVSFAVPDPKYGEDVAAAVVLRPDAVRAGAEDRILAHCRTRLATFMVPHRLVVVDAIPVGPTGKLRRLDMARLLGLRE
jgi:acyl-CoA synthetase (AMP-forming)/AMP-acid ligase II